MIRSIVSTNSRLFCQVLRSFQDKAIEHVILDFLFVHDETFLLRYKRTRLLVLSWTLSELGMVLTSAGAIMASFIGIGKKKKESSSAPSQGAPSPASSSQSSEDNDARERRRQSSWQLKSWRHELKPRTELCVTQERYRWWPILFIKQKLIIVIEITFRWRDRRQ